MFLNEFYNFSHTDIEISVWKKWLLIFAPLKSRP